MSTELPFEEEKNPCTYMHSYLTKKHYVLRRIADTFLPSIQYQMTQAMVEWD